MNRFKIELAGNLDQRLSEVGLDAPLVDPVGIDQGTAGNLSADYELVELGLLGMLAGFDGEQALSVSSR